jgi:excisionase family DNA binding protein
VAKALDNRALANDALVALRRRPSRFILPDGSTIRIPKSAVDGLIELLTATAAGDEATAVRSQREVTTQQAADLLNVSRPTVVKLIDEGSLPSRMVGSHRRDILADLLVYRQDVVAKRRAVLDRMTADVEALGLYD